MSKPQVAVAGADGQLGLTLQELWPATALSSDYDLACSDVNSLDITRPEQIDARLDPLRVEVLINAAAYTAVDRAESEQEQAMSINGSGAANLAAWAKENGARLIQVSTDFVFDGDKRSPYLPDDSPHPRSAYGRSKLEGERAVLDRLADRSVVLRTAWLYSPYQTNFVKTMLRLMQERDTLNVVDDQVGSPTSTYSLANCILRIVERGDVSGIFHWSDEGEISWYQFACAIQEEAIATGVLSEAIAVNPISTDQFPT